MFFNKTEDKNANTRIADSIRKDLVQTLRKLGISMADICIDTKSGNLNVSVSIKENNN